MLGGSISQFRSCLLYLKVSHKLEYCWALWLPAFKYGENDRVVLTHRGFPSFPGWPLHLSFNLGTSSSANDKGEPTGWVAFLVTTTSTLYSLKGLPFRTLNHLHWYTCYPLYNTLKWQRLNIHKRELMQALPSSWLKRTMFVSGILSTRTLLMSKSDHQGRLRF